MSMSVLKIIPADQEYVPSPEQQANALALFREMVRYGEIEATVYEDLEFIDAGKYCGYVLCLAAIASQLIRLRAPISLRIGIVT